jgi:hypothetical protein
MTGRQHGEYGTKAMAIVIHWLAQNDYYEGDKAQIFVNDEMVWEGYSCDSLTSILDALAVPYVVTGKRHIQKLMEE